MTAIFGSIGLSPSSHREMAELLNHRGLHVALEADGGVEFGGRYTERSNIARGENCLVAIGGNPFEVAERSERISIEAQDLAVRYRAAGAGALRELNGHFAVAIWDLRRERLFLGRDPFGVCPLYVARGPNWLAFSTEYKALLLLDGIDLTIDRDAVQRFMASGWAPHGRTFFSAISQVPPGGVLVSTDDDARIARIDVRRSSYQIPRADVPVSDVRDHVLHAIEGYSPDCGRRYGVMLSSGIDSAIITAALRRRVVGDLNTFTVGYGQDDPEILGARQTAIATGTNHHELIVRPHQLSSLLPETIRTMEDPGGYDEFPCLFALHRKARNFVDVIFSGNVSDTLFASMSWHRRIWNEKHWPGAYLLYREFDQAEAEGRLPHGAIARLIWRATRGAAWPAPCSVIDAAPLPRKTRSRHSPSPLLDELRSVLERFDGRMGAQEMLAARWGLDFRMPYAERGLIDLALRIPDRQKMNSRSGKLIFREAARQFLPPHFSRRPKRIQHLKYDAEMADWIHSCRETVLSQEVVRSRNLISYDSLARALDALRTTPNEVAFKRVWNAIALEHWARIFLDSKPGSQPASIGHDIVVSCQQESTS
ncbi:asparagine synthase [Phreatobacter sp. AB_2022a]|uniref:asparagine synthase n=1 Tax=Phreatobacter sp. AB_2022a TaxID=3003134 RepID=UPI002286D1E8|nr:asparagine synthetase B [Phreatobacter sp. AB_2022a]MCZ0736890.1 asparagine synthetase B [Phreatobacter sp. AB_2022a]